MLCTGVPCMDLPFLRALAHLLSTFPRLQSLLMLLLSPPPLLKQPMSLLQLLLM